MARSRNLKPGFFKNEKLAECSPLARLLFAGLWCLADREGRLEDRPKRIRVEILPYDEGNVDDMLNELHQGGFILRYQVENERYIQVLNFTKHQNPHHREAESSIPAPTEPEQCPIHASDKPGYRHGHSPDKPETSLADSLNLIPDSLNLIPMKPARLPTASKQDENFGQFWQKYPIKKGKQDAQKAWQKLKPSGDLAATILSALDIQKISPDWLKEGGRYAPHPASWLNGRRWEDETTGSGQPNQPANSLFAGAI